MAHIFKQKKTQVPSDSSEDDSSTDSDEELLHLSLTGHLCLLRNKRRQQFLVAAPYK